MKTGTAKRLKMTIYRTCPCGETAFGYNPSAVEGECSPSYKGALRYTCRNCRAVRFITIMSK